MRASRSVCLKVGVAHVHLSRKSNKGSLIINAATNKTTFTYNFFRNINI